MNEGIKLFVIGFGFGILASLLCVCGCYLYTRSVRRTNGYGGSVGETEQRRSEDNQRLEDNNGAAAALIQKAKDILDSGKRTGSD